MRLLIGSQKRGTGRTVPVTPHEHKVTLGRVHHAGAADVADAIDAATEAAVDWSRRSPAERAEPFLRAADPLKSGP